MPLRESQIQIQVVSWFERQFPEISDLLVHYPIGERRIKKQVWSKSQKKLIWICPDGQKLKRMGAKKDFPDLTLYVARHGFHGLIIELKKEGEKPRDDQIAYLQKLQKQGFLALWYDNFDEVKKTILRYLR